MGTKKIKIEVCPYCGGTEFLDDPEKFFPHHERRNKKGSSINRQ